MPNDDYLIEIDIRLFDKTLADCINQLEVLGDKFEKELGRLSYWAGSLIVAEAKRNHPFTSRTGTLVRSIHCSPAGANHDRDETEADSGSELKDSKGTEGIYKDGFVFLQIGSWLRYAYTIERGYSENNQKAYPYLLPAFEKEFENTVRYMTEGLRKLLETVKK